MGRLRGFTLVELVTVVMVLGILSVGTVKFITDSSQGFFSTMGRTALAGDARFVAERLAREVRDALPNSVRVSGGCVEFVPTVGASTYTTLPVAVAALTFLSVPIDPLPIPANSRVAVFPDLSVYALGNPGEVSPAVTVSSPNGNNEVTVTFASNHRFVTESPGSRYFFVGSPVSYCVDGEQLFRYNQYGFQNVQLTTGGLPSTRPGRALVARNVDTLTPFTVNDATLNRNAVLEIDLNFVRDGDEVRIEHAVQVRNVP